MKFKSQVFTQVSGSVGGITYSHNKGGLYTRARSIPTDPATPLQTAVRNIFTTLVTAWTSVLTAQQRADWAVYALNTPVIDRLGDSVSLSGQQMYIRSNTPRVQAALPRVDDAPTTFNLGDFTQPSFAATDAGDVVSVTFDNTDAWANEDDSSMIVRTSRPQNPSKLFFKGPYNLAGTIDGDAVTPPTSPAAISSPYVLTAGQLVFVTVRVSRADGRLSTSFRGVGVVV